MTGDLARLSSIRQNLERRALILTAIRDFFREQGFLEVETPVRMPAIAPEKYITPVESGDWFLATSPELHMKRLLAAGYERLFQLIHCFRKGERGRLHNPEFTMLEWYRAGGDYCKMVDDTERLVVAVAGQLGPGTTIPYQGQEIDITPPWPRVRVRDAFLQNAGWDPTTHFDPLRFDEDTVNRVVPSFPPCRPTVLMDYPASVASLARLKPGDSTVAERTEIFIGGLEVANAYSELTDPREQRERFLQEAAEIERDGTRKAPIPWNFLEAVGDMPACCGGIALGVDRLVMLLCNAATIDEVVAFTVDNA